MVEMLNYHGNPNGLFLFRKHFKKYVQNIGPFEQMMDNFMQANTADQFEDALEQCEEHLETVFGKLVFGEPDGRCATVLTN